MSWKNVGQSYSPGKVVYTLEVDPDTQLTRLTAQGAPDPLWGVEVVRGATADELSWAGPQSPELDPERFEQYKTELGTLVEAEVARRIEASGFEYPPGSGNIFSLTPEDRDYWTTLQTMIGTGFVDLSASPVTVRTRDNRAEVVLDSNMSATALYFSACLTGRAIQQLGRVARTEIAAATTYDEAADALSRYLAS